MRVAVCDDLKEILDEIKQLLEKISFVKTVDVFSDINLFYEELKDGTKYDVVLMDIDWKKDKTGIDFSQELVTISPYTQIIYVTAYTLDYVEDAVLKTNNLCGFVMKPVKIEVLQKSLEKVRKQREQRDGKLVIKYKSNVHVIPYEMIYYLESDRHKVSVKVGDQEYQCTEKLETLKSQLGEQFLDCHKSFLVNMDKIAEIRKMELELVSGDIIPISKKKYGEAKARFFEYMAERI